MSLLVRESLVNLKNGAKVVHTFSLHEYMTRLKLLREQMVARNVNAVLLTSHHAISYYTDFLYCSFGRSYGLVITLTHSTLIVANIDGGHPWRKAVVDTVVSYTDWEKNNYMKAVINCLSTASIVGVEFDHLSLDKWSNLKTTMPDINFIDFAQACMSLRFIKSQEEIELIASGAQICDIGAQALVNAIQPNVPEYEIALISTQTMVREIAHRFPDTDIMDTWTWFQSGINTDGAHNPVTTRKVKSGDILSLNCFTMISSYYIAIERTLFLNHASPDHLRFWKVNCLVHDEGKKMIKPGVRCGDIALALNKIYLIHDMLQYRTFGYGHSFGVLCHYYGREAGLELREDIDTILEVGMVISMEPMLMIPDGTPGAGGYREHDILVVTPDGNRNLTHFPYGPEHNIVTRDE